MAERSGLIVVGINGSSASREALAWALVEAATWRAPLEVVHAWQRHRAGHWLPGGRIAAQDRADRLFETQLSAARDWFGPDPPMVIESIREGRPTAVLLEAAGPASLLVLGAARRSRRATASVSLECVRWAGCPVVVVPTGEQAGTGR
jgi:nucleotide-binding universal stress UspA family protein